MDIDEILIHPGFNPQKRQADIALIRLAVEVKFSDFVKPICLPTDQSLWLKDYTGYSFTIAGLRNA